MGQCPTSRSLQHLGAIILGHLLGHLEEPHHGIIPLPCVLLVEPLFNNMFSPLQPHIFWELCFNSTKGLRVGILNELANMLGLHHVVR